jgi:hypothetical protein
MPGRAVRIFFAFLALAVFWTWPLARHLSSRIPHDPGDPVLNAWLLWWNAHAVPFTTRWWSPPIFFPMNGALALSEHLAGISVIATPLQFLHVNALGAYNIALILSFALSAFFTFVLVSHLFDRAPYPYVISAQWWRRAHTVLVHIERGSSPISRSLRHSGCRWRCSRCTPISTMGGDGGWRSSPLRSSFDRSRTAITCCASRCPSRAG